VAAIKERLERQTRRFEQESRCALLRGGEESLDVSIRIVGDECAPLEASGSVLGDMDEGEIRNPALMF
jgi:hypothetical protein